MFELPHKLLDNLRLRIFRNQEISRKPLKSSCPPKSQNLAFCKKSQKISCEIFLRKTYFPYFRRFVSNRLFNILWRNRSPFLTLCRPFHFTFCEDFIIWKVPFALQIDIRGKSVAKDSWICYFFFFGLNALPVAAEQYLWREFTFFY